MPGGPHDNLRGFPPGPGVAPHPRHHLLPIGPPLPPQCVGFHIDFQQIARVMVRAATGKLARADSLPGLIHPVPPCLGPMDRVSIHDQVHPLFGLSHEAATQPQRTVQVNRSWNTSSPPTAMRARRVSNRVLPAAGPGQVRSGQVRPGQVIPDRVRRAPLPPRTRAPWWGCPKSAS